MSSESRRMPLALAVAVAAACAVAAAPAAAAQGDPYLASCTTLTAIAPCVEGTRSGTMSAAMSPDGRQVVFGAYPMAPTPPQPDVLLSYDRDPGTGALSPRPGLQGCFSTDGTDGTCSLAKGLSAGYELAFTPDGESLYTSDSSGISHFERDPATNQLTYTGCYGYPSGCVPIQTGGGSAVRAIVADDDRVYARVTGAVLVFDRHPDTHALAQKAGGGCLSDAIASGCTKVTGISGDGYQLALTPAHLYVTSRSPGGVAVFGRAPDGTLSQAPGTSGGCISSDGASGTTAGQCVDGSDQLAGAWGVLATSDGRNVYVGASAGVVAYSRSASTGSLTEIECLTEAPTSGCKDVAGVQDAMDLAEVPDGSEVIVGGLESRKVGFLGRSTDGTLGQRAGRRGCLSHDGSAGACETLAGLASYAEPVIAPDGLHLYLSSFQTGLVAHLERDFAPVCDGGTTAVPHETATPVELGCSDPNGDNLAFSVVSPPSQGSLGAVDAGAASVLYTPSPGFSGTDSFTFQATARGVQSNVATAVLEVAGSTAAPPPVPPPGDTPPPDEGPVPDGDSSLDDELHVDSTVIARWRAGRRSTRVRRLVVADIPAEGELRLRCGKGQERAGCPFRRKRIGVPADGRKSLTRLFRGRRLAAGAVLEIRVTAPSHIGMAVRYKMRRNRKPSVRTLCIPSGGGAPELC